MKWNRIVVDAIHSGVAEELLRQTAVEMQMLLDYVRDIEPELYWNFKNAALGSTYGSANYEFGMEESQ